MDNPELAAIAAALEDISHNLTRFNDREEDRERRAEERLEMQLAQARAPERATSPWPWAPGTQTQGFLTGRWNRRAGNVYPGAVGAIKANSPIAGGQDANARVAVESGAPRVEGSREKTKDVSGTRRTAG